MRTASGAVWLGRMACSSEADRTDETQAHHVRSARAGHPKGGKSVGKLPARENYVETYLGEWTLNS